MHFFSGLRFLGHEHIPHCRARMDTTFEFFALNFAFSGRIDWAMDCGRKSVLAAPIMWWTWIGPRFTYGALEGESWNHYYVVFIGPRAQRYWRDGLLPESDTPYLCVKDALKTQEQWENLFTAIRGQKSDNDEATNLLEGLLLSLHHRERIDASAEPPLQREVESVAKKIRAAPTEPWDVQKLALKAATSPAHFRRVFRTMHGLPPRQFLLKARLEEAARMLRTTAEPIKSIAEKVRFLDVFYFSKMFKKYHGLPPGSYRRQMRLLYQTTG